MNTPTIGRIDHIEQHHNRTIVAIELPANSEAFTPGDIVTITQAATDEPETPPATDEGNWLDTTPGPTYQQ